MKKKVFKFIGSSAAIAFAALSLASCGSTKDSNASASADGDNTYKVGILQYVSHDALDKATAGFKAQILANLPEGKEVEFVVKNPEADPTALQTMATALVRECDLVLGNATPAATQLIAARATEGKVDLPILFTSVTDPVAASLINPSKRDNNVTGTSDINPVAQQIDLIFDVDSTVDKVGYLYTVSEVNSQAQCQLADEYLKATYPNVTSETQTFAEQSGISTAINKLVNDGCDVVYLPTDNLVAANIPSVTNVTDPAQVFTIGGEESMVAAGATITVSINYTELGATTGDMAIDILLNGKDPDDIAVAKQTEAAKFNFAKNDKSLSACGITLSDAFKTKYGIE